MQNVERKFGRILVNSLPKSGTHLLTRAVEVFSYQEYAKNRSVLKKTIDYLGLGTPFFFTYREAKNNTKRRNLSQKTRNNQIPIGTLTPQYVDVDIMHRWLSAVPLGQYIRGHILNSPVLSDMLKELNFGHVFIIRHPFAVITSLIHHISEAGFQGLHHFLHKDFSNMQPYERLKFIVEGGEALYAKEKTNSFEHFCRSMFAWKEDSYCLFLRFEDLVGEQGSGSKKLQQQTVNKMVEYLGVAMTEQIITKLDHIYTGSSPTFRIGKIDSWKNFLDTKSLKYLKQKCGNLCREMGYDDF